MKLIILTICLITSTIFPRINIASKKYSSRQEEIITNENMTSCMSSFAIILTRGKCVPRLKKKIDMRFLAINSFDDKIKRFA